MPPLQIRGSRTRTGKRPVSVSSREPHAAPANPDTRHVTRTRAATAFALPAVPFFKRPQAAEHHNFSFLFFNF